MKGTCGWFPPPVEAPIAWPALKGGKLTRDSPRTENGWLLQGSRTATRTFKDRVEGKDPQLERAIEEILKQLND